MSGIVSPRSSGAKIWKRNPFRRNSRDGSSLTGVGGVSSSSHQLQQQNSQQPQQSQQPKKKNSLVRNLRNSFRKERSRTNNSNMTPPTATKQDSSVTPTTSAAGAAAPPAAPKYPRNTTVNTSVMPDASSESCDTNPQSPYSLHSYGTDESGYREEKKDAEEWSDERRRRDIIFQKQRIKERDGFCRRVDSYDGSVIVVDQKPAYEIGNYLGGGVAGVVYEGHRLRPLHEYPIRPHDESDDEEDEEPEPTSPAVEVEATGFFCGGGGTGEPSALCGGTPMIEADEEPVTSPISQYSGVDNGNANVVVKNNDNKARKSLFTNQEEIDVAIEATVSQNEQNVLLDAQDAPSRSKHYLKAASVKVDENDKSLKHGLTDEAVAIKILNPVGYRILQTEGLVGAVTVKEGDAMDADVKKGLNPIEERHVWWLVNPNSRNLRTLQRYNNKNDGEGNGNNEGGISGSVQVDRGSVDKGLRLSLIAAYVDPRTNKLRELTLTRCIEIWGHIPFSASDVEFEDMLSAIERVNAGQAPPKLGAHMNDDFNVPPGRVGTDVTGKHSVSSNSECGSPHSPIALKNARTGLLRAALTERKTVYCKELNAYIAIPAVPSKYLRWLRQRRAATKEIRNMMSIGRHKNVLHLFEVLEFIQESKSTMFLILELVKGGELFDLISSSAGKSRKSQDDTEETERMMRKFFNELASGIHYCHKNGIAHRDLKPENLLVHTPRDGQAILKIADFGLSAAFGPNAKMNSDNDTVLDSLASPNSPGSIRSFSPTEFAGSPTSLNSGSPIRDSYDKIIASSAEALSFLTCGAMETVLCFPNAAEDNGPQPLRRMTSVVGSPHYVAPEIISQNDDGKGRKVKGAGYDGAKADVWSAGVILYAMLFRSLPFGEDLLRCPRYQTYKKWYDEIRLLGGRRASAAAALNPYFSEADEREQLGPHWFFPATTSKESRDLIVAMLNPNPPDRLSVGQVLEHPWVCTER